MKLILLKILGLFLVNTILLIALIFIIPVSLLEPMVFRDSKFRDIPDNYQKLFKGWHKLNKTIVETKSVK